MSVNVKVKKKNTHVPLRTGHKSVYIFGKLWIYLIEETISGKEHPP